MRINNTLDSFNVAECSFGKNFSGLNLGNIQSLNLAKATAITWESCDNNVTGVALYYRVYEQGMPSGGWNSLNMPENYNTLVGPYTARYRSQFSNINLATGLTPGKIYTLEVYYLAQVDTLGNDFVPETTMTQNNNGLNYKLTFTYGGASAPPFTVVNTQLVNEKCPGDSTGIAGVTVYGNQSNLFYQWSNVNNNFHTLYELTSGTYTVTVSGINGYTQSQTMIVSHPAPIVITFANVQSVICGNTPGSASAVVNGGIPPYQFLWETGEPDSIASIPLPGPWHISVTDANGCQTSSVIQIGGSSILERSIGRTICQGDSYVLGGQTFSAAGNYQVLVDGNGACDTLFSLALSVLNPGVVLNDLPTSEDITCLHPTLTLCVPVQPAMTYEWKRLNTVVSNAACLTINAGDLYTLTATLAQSGQTCAASAQVLVNSHLAAPQVSVSGAAVYLDCASTHAEVVLTATTDAVEPTFAWTQNGNLISVADTCKIIVDNPLNFNAPSILVTDIYGCQGTSGSVNILIQQHPGAPDAFPAVTPASGPNTSDGKIEVIITGGDPPYAIYWQTGATTPVISGLLPGQYCYTVTDAAGCATTGCVAVDYTIGTSEPVTDGNIIFPNPAMAGGMIEWKGVENSTQDPVLIECIDMQGKICWKTNQRAVSSSIFIQLPSDVQPGYYVLRGVAGRQVVIKTLCVF
ncbi:MAG: hypothetical protein JNM22_15840 [Saprospiraceae bacterium]|nr:hypothetical protein [Saprospiraceae bacterium]